MIAANIGRIFLDAYNEKNKCNYSAKTFFVEKYFTLFFDHEKYMQWATNSPFVQGIKKGIAPTIAERKVKLEVLIDKISRNEADASIAIGFPSLDLTASTSGQITSMSLPLKEEDVYLSWIGSGFGIGVQSGLSLLFSDKQILLDLYDGWQLYREFLNKTPNLRGNQINTWNGQWIAHRYNKNTYDESNPTAAFNPFGSMKDGGLEATTQSWTKVLVGIARNYPESTLTAYVYSLGQTNITVGFVPFELPRIRQPYELYSKYFGTTKIEQVEQLFGTAFGFTKACQMGAIGVNALEPKGFRDCLDKGVVPKYNETDEEKTINFNTYQIWLLAMLNNEQLWEKAQQIAKTLNSHSTSDTNAKKVKSQEVTNLLASVNKKQFIDGLTAIVKGSQNIEQLAEIAELINVMPIDNVPYFLTLIRFQYAIENKKS
ncbi:MAG: hypothetical protein K0M50_21310 [Prolixibacteraceae bacterium]|nr:hypothetical protein [Prolixibacteraceae bacterium]